ncbi:MAG: hypothetical protein Q4D89_13410 [Arachnia propionica]|uniref:hypothetical protein n=1 Tax=Arachnia propionica TaxID=1750 RepID=UPI002703F378|nr:hypothetical protein [Arachnia propionica]
MLGFAALDHRPGGPVAVWLVSRTEPAEASSTNAVVIDADDPERLRKIHGLTRDRIVVLTPDSTTVEPPVEKAAGVDLLDRFVEATRAHQEAIVTAIRAHAATRKGQKLVEPTFPPPPETPTQWPSTPELRALQLARWLARVWTNWLVGDGERLRRTTQPRTGLSPWIMPEELNQHQLLELPPALLDDLHVQPLTPPPA